MNIIFFDNTVVVYDKEYVKMYKCICANEKVVCRILESESGCPKIIRVYNCCFFAAF